MMTIPLYEDFAALAEAPGLLATLDGKRIYVTGATGQIGWYLVHFITYLVQDGRLKCDLTAHIRSAEKLTRKFPDHANLPCTFAVTDNAAQPLAGDPFNMVIHCASKASPKFFANSPVDVMVPNGILVYQMLEQLRVHSPSTRFVYLSTTGVTGFIPDVQRPSRETDYGPLSCTDLGNCYLESKRFGEMLVLAYFKQYGIPVFIVRPSITYGPGFDLDDGRSYADFAQSLLNKQPIMLTSDGCAIRNFLYIADFIKGLFTVIAKAPAGSVFNIASPQPISILDLATQLNNLIFENSRSPVERMVDIASPYSRVNFKSTDASVDQLTSLGWRQEINPSDGFMKVLRHYQECAE